jgi:hypothetical protein
MGGGNERGKEGGWMGEGEGWERGGGRVGEERIDWE